MGFYCLATVITTQLWILAHLPRHSRIHHRPLRDIQREIIFTTEYYVKCASCGVLMVGRLRSTHGALLVHIPLLRC